MAILESFEVKPSRKYRWRFVVKDDSSYSLVSTDWQWCEINNDCGFDFWRDADSFPTYNFNDGTYAGLPKFLTKEYEKHNLGALYDKWLDIKINEYYEKHNLSAFKPGDILNWEQYCQVKKYINEVIGNISDSYSYFMTVGDIGDGKRQLITSLPKPKTKRDVTV